MPVFSAVMHFVFTMMMISRCPWLLTAVMDLFFNLAVYGPPVSAEGQTWTFYLFIQDYHSGNLLYSFSDTDRISDFLSDQSSLYECNQERKGVYLGTKIKRILKKFQLKRTSVLLTRIYTCWHLCLMRQLFQLQIIQGEDYIECISSHGRRKRVS